MYISTSKIILANEIQCLLQVTRTFIFVKLQLFFSFSKLPPLCNIYTHQAVCSSVCWQLYHGFIIQYRISDKRRCSRLPQRKHVSFQNCPWKASQCSKRTRALELDLHLVCSSRLLDACLWGSDLSNLELVSIHKQGPHPLLCKDVMVKSFIMNICYAHLLHDILSIPFSLIFRNLKWDYFLVM